MNTALFKKILNKTQKKNIVIMGHMGSGKSVFGKKIAQYYKIDHIDTDAEITLFEKNTINEIFLRKGEPYFRKIESSIVLKNIKKRNIIISLGGGSILSQEVRESIFKHSLSVYLDTDLKILKKRLITSKKRPLLKDCNILSTLKQLDIARRKHYLNADIIINNSGTLNKSLVVFKKIFSLLDG